MHHFAPLREEFLEYFGAALFGDDFKRPRLSVAQLRVLDGVWANFLGPALA